MAVNTCMVEGSFDAEMCVVFLMHGVHQALLLSGYKFSL